jgi:hypothetical protein
MTTIDISLNNICNQRQQQLSNFSTPPIRYNPVSPYPTYNQKQLNMRRKAEILNYSAARTNTKTNNYTKAEKYALLVSRKNQKQSFTTIFEPSFGVVYYPNAVQGNIFEIRRNTTVNVFDFNVIKANTLSCAPNNNMLPTPTSSSDVPGPIEYLVKDLTVPLYNYATNENAYSIYPNFNAQFWNTIVQKDVLCSNGIDTMVLKLGILNGIEQPSYNFSFSTPFSIYFSAGLSSRQSFDSRENIIAIEITAFVKYNDSQVTYINPVLDINGSNSMTFDVSINNGTPRLIVNQYSGILTVSNLNLYTRPGYVYDIYLNFDVTQKLDKKDKNLSDSLIKPSVGVYCNLTNLSNSIYQNTSNVTLTTDITNLANIPPPSFSFNGI